MNFRAFFFKKNKCFSLSPKSWVSRCCSNLLNSAPCMWINRLKCYLINLRKNNSEVRGGDVEYKMKTRVCMYIYIYLYNICIYIYIIFLLFNLCWLQVAAGSPSIKVSLTAYHPSVGMDHHVWNLFCNPSLHTWNLISFFFFLLFFLSSGRRNSKCPYHYLHLCHRFTWCETHGTAKIKGAKLGTWKGGF